MGGPVKIDVSLPAEFSRFAPRVAYVVQRSATEYSSSCPNCGGTKHADGEYPDRCRWFTDGKPRGWCRNCGGLFWPDERGAWKITPEEQEKWRQQREAAELRRKAEAERALQLLRQEKTWLQYVDLMTEQARQWWENRGVPRDWQDYLQVGYLPSKVYLADGEERIAPAYTIPYFHTSASGPQFATLQYRLDTTDTTDRYRFERGLHASYYETEPDVPLGERIVICEGAIKAIVSRVYGLRGYSVLAVPSKATWGGIVEAVAEAEQVFVLLDPDGQAQAHKLARAIGPQARVVRLFDKVDDLILQHGMSASDLAAYLRQAV